MIRSSQAAVLLLGLMLWAGAVGAQSNPLAVFEREVREFCEPEAGPLRGQSLLASEARLARAADDGKLDQAGWWHLACLRAQLAAQGSVAPPGHPFLMPLGNSWRHGASMVLARQLADSVSARAAALLAVLNADHVVSEPATWTLAQLERAIAAGVRHPRIFRGCLEQAWWLPDPDRALACAMGGLTIGEDSTLHLLTISRRAALRGDTTLAWSAFLAAARAVSDSADRTDLKWHLTWFLTPTEDSAWHELPLEATEAWVRDLMVSRDVRDGRPSGARVVEHMRRLEYVHEQFRLAVVPVQRQRLLRGVAMPDGPGGGFSVEVVTPASETPAEGFREYQRWQSTIDDRGAVWMRFGPPKQREHFTAGGAGNYLQRETWRYDLDGRELVLSFESEQYDGSQEATRLVTAVVGEHFCGITTRRCFQAQRSWSAAWWNRRRASAPENFIGLPASEMTELRREDQQLITEATTKDDNAPRHERHLETTAQFLRLWHPRTGLPMALVPWAINTEDLLDGIAKDRREIAMRMEVRWFDPMTGQAWDTVTAGALTRPDRTGKDAFVVGVLALPARLGITAWSVRAVRDSTASGRAFVTSAAPIASGSLQLSDLVLGVAGQGVTWVGPTVPIMLAPLATVERKSPVQLYYQVRNQDAPTEMTTTISVAKAGALGATPAFSVTFRDRIGPGITEIHRELGLDRLQSGRHLLTVIVEDAAGGRRVTRSTDLLVR